MNWQIQSFSEIILAVFTIVLAIATIALAWYTKALSSFTEMLVKIEAKRDERDLQETRRKELATALLSAEAVQKIYAEHFAQQLNIPSGLPLADIKEVELLHSYRRYIEDPDCHQHLDFLCTIFDSIRRDRSQSKIDQQAISKIVKTLQERIQWFIDKTRKEIGT